METILQNQQGILFYFLQVNLIWAVGFGFIYLFARRMDIRWQYNIHLVLQLYLPVAVAISLLFINSPESSGAPAQLSYSIFYNSTAPQFLATQPPETHWLLAALPFAVAAIVSLVLLRFLQQFLALFSVIRTDREGPLMILKRIQERQNIKRDVRIVLTRFFKSPFSFGFHRGYIVLPEDYPEKLSELQIEMIIRHELIHIQRHDFLVNLFQKLVRILFIYNPLIHLNDRLIDEKREMLCDRAVLQQPGVEKKAYAETLLAVTGLLNVPAPLSPVVPFFNQSSQLKKRILIMKENYFPSRAIYRQWVTMSIILCSFLAITFSALNAAEDGKGDKRTFIADGYEVTIDDERVVVIKDGKRSVHLKDSDEYREWTEKFAELEAQEEMLRLQEKELMAVQKKLEKEHLNLMKAHEKKLRKYELQAEKNMQQLSENHQKQLQMAEKERMKMESEILKKQEKLQQQHQLALEKQQALMALKQERIQENMALNIKEKQREMMHLRKKLDEQRAYLEKEEQRLNEIEIELSESLYKALLADGYLNRDETTFAFELCKDYIKVNEEKITDADIGKYEDLVGKITGHKLSGDDYYFSFDNEK